MVTAQSQIAVKERIRYKIDGRWSPYDFYEFFRVNLQIMLYVIRANNMSKISALEILDTKNLLELHDSSFSWEYFQVNKIEYGSPGIIDITGVGVAIGHLKDVLIRLLDSYEKKNSRLLVEEKRKIQNEFLKIELFKQYLELAKKNEELTAKQLDFIKTIAQGDYSKQIQQLSTFITNQKLKEIE